MRKKLNNYCHIKKKVGMKSYLPIGKMCLSRTTGGHFFRALIKQFKSFYWLSQHGICVIITWLRNLLPAIGWEQANFSLILNLHRSANWRARVHKFISQIINEYEKLEQLRIYIYVTFITLLPLYNKFTLID